MAAALGVVAPAGTAAAQAERDDAAPVAELVVTGSRLPQTEVTAYSPVAVVSGEGIRASGALTLEVALNRLPQMSPSFSSAANNPSANGAAYLDLRGLGERRNLVLLQGRRIVGANASNSVDLNTIPNALIERVEVVTGGASAVYGADAVAGVVNVILRERFEGLEASGRTLVSGRGDGREHELSAAFGRRFGEVSLSGGLAWSKREEIGKGARPFSRDAATPTGFLPGGAYMPAATNLPGQAAVNAVFGGYGVAPGAVSTRGGFAGFGFNPDGSLFATGAPGVPAFDVQNFRGPRDEVVERFFPDVFAYNFEPFNKLILPLERRSAALFAEAYASERVRLYGQGLAVRYTASTALAPTPAPTAPNPLYPGLNVLAFTIPVTNPFIPPDLARLLASRTGNAPALAGAGANEEFTYRFRTVALGPRQSDNRAEVVNLLAGATVRLDRDWAAEGYASFGRYQRRERQGGLLSVRRTEQLLDSPTGGREFCDGGFNPFGGQITGPCRDFLEVAANYATEVEQENAVATLSGPLFTFAAGEMRAVLGAERRVVRFDFDPPTGLSPGDVSGFTSLAALSGSVRFHEVFAEAAAPLVRDAAFAHAIDLALGYRYSHERSSGGVHAYKAELGWAPAETLRLRGSYQRAVRSPDVFERFEPPVGFFARADDPCAADNPARTSAVLALCREQAARLGFAPSVADSLQRMAMEVPTTLSGNPDLEPETSDSLTIGGVWRPGSYGWLRDPRLAVDAYDIKVTGAIAYLDPQIALNACYDIGGGNPGRDPASPACAAVQRSSVDFSVAAVRTPRANQAFLRTRGVDASAAFGADLEDATGGLLPGSLDLRLAASRLIDFEEQASALRARVDYAGTIAGSGLGYQSLPRWKGLVDVDWTAGAAIVGVSGRYIGAMEHRLQRDNPADPATGVGDATYWDVRLGYAVRDGVQLRGGVLNLFDRRPEVFSPAVDANTEPSTYDVIGRRFWIALTLRL